MLPAAARSAPSPELGAEGAMQMDPAVRTIAISCATAIIGYISSSLLNMRAARPLSHEAAALAPRPEVGCLAPPHEAPLQRRLCTRLQLWRHSLARAHPRAHSTHQAPSPGAGAQ